MIDIDVLPASTESKGGDSVLIRVGQFSYTNPRQNRQKVILVDSGYQENAERIEAHLEQHYHTSTIDLAIITHPDLDHISGFARLIQNGKVKVLRTCIHDPWNHAHILLKKGVDGRRTKRSIQNKFDVTLNILSDILDVVESKNKEAFGLTTLSEFNLKILGPSKKRYQYLLHQFPGMDRECERPKITEEIYTETSHPYSQRVEHFLKEPVTSAKNDSSAIVLLHDDSNNPVALFTGDGGVEGLTEALDIADQNRVAYKNVDLLQIPHHGSIKNINEYIIERISPRTAYVSAPPDKLEHPSKLALNYFTQEKSIPTYHVKHELGVLFRYDGAPERPGWGSSAPKVECFSLVNLLRRGLGR